MAPATVVCTYRVRADEDDAFLELLARHWPLLHDLGVVTDDPATVLRSLDRPTTFVEVFTWTDEGFARARSHPDVLDVWERMEVLCEDRDGHPSMEFPHYEAVPLHA